MMMMMIERMFNKLLKLSLIINQTNKIYHLKIYIKGNFDESLLIFLLICYKLFKNKYFFSFMSFCKKKKIIFIKKR